MAENKTQPTGSSVLEFIEAVEDEQKKQDAYELLNIMKKCTQEEAVLWGPSLIGFGKYRYKYESGREGVFFIAGFSPRKTALSIYIMSGFKEYSNLLEKLGKYKTGKSCLYIKRLSDVDRDVLEKLIDSSVKWMKKKYG